MLAIPLLPLLLVACGRAQDEWWPDVFPGNIRIRPGMMSDPPAPVSAVQKVAVDTAGACSCVCTRTAEVTVAYQTKYNACVGRADRHRLRTTAAGLQLCLRPDGRGYCGIPN